MLNYLYFINTILFFHHFDRYKKYKAINLFFEEKSRLIKSHRKDLMRNKFIDFG